MLLSAEKGRGCRGGGLFVCLRLVLGDVIVLFVGAHLCLESWLIYILGIIYLIVLDNKFFVFEIGFFF